MKSETLVFRFSNIVHYTLLLLLSTKTIILFTLKGADFAVIICTHRKRSGIERNLQSLLKRHENSV